MKIIHVITTIDLGGAEKQLVQLADQQQVFGHDIEIIFLKGDGKLESEFTSKNIVVNKKVKNRNIIFQLIWLFSYLNRKDNVVHAHLSRSEIFTSLVKVRFKLVISKHNSEQIFPSGSKLVSKILAKFVFFRANKIITISKAVKRYLIDEGEIYDNKKVTVIYYGIKSKMSKNKITSNKKNKIFGTICRFEQQKDVHTILKAWQKYQVFYPNDKLHIVGTGSLASSLKKFTLEVKLRNVSWYQPTKNIKKIYQELSVFILSTNYEGFGLVLLEAMAFNIPILASNNSSIPEVLGKHHPGLFITGDFKGLLQKMVRTRDASYHKSLIESNKNRYPLFSIEESTKQILNVYEQFVLKK